uniref:Uncharacterized protein n=1 Tax=Branchiostoma floridae TaxID=7739 RepID=C3Z3T2_BRAFL|eukprot:XP_002596834.1 hypothetical protein BRAFLDRAFT_99733 [Branchiostoma floridae]
MEAETLDGEPVLVAVLDAVKQFLDKMKVDPSAASLHLDRTKLSQQQVAHEMVTEHLAELCNKLQTVVKLEPGTSSAVPSTSSAVSEGIEERLRNMESHLKVKSGTLVNTDIYSRLKQLENRILHLEGLSPEYFQLGEMSIEEIEERMKTLRESLLSKKDTLLYPTTNTDDFQ